MVQPCSRDNSSSYSLLFSMDHHDSSTLVDCTLSLGTPSTRNTGSSSVSSSSLIHRSPSHYKAAQQPATSANFGGDPLLLARRCANCDTTSTPLWRNGPRGPKSLCNACGIRYKKEERRAAATSSTAAAATSTNLYSSSKAAAHHQDMDQVQVPYLSWRLNVVPPQYQLADHRPSLFQYHY